MIKIGDVDLFRALTELHFQTFLNTFLLEEIANQRPLNPQRVEELKRQAVARVNDYYHSEVLTYRSPE